MNLLNTKKSKESLPTEKKLTPKIILSAIALSTGIVVVGFAIVWFVVLSPVQQFAANHGFNFVENLVFEPSNYYQPPPSALWNNDRPNFIFDKDTLNYIVALYRTNSSVSVTVEPEYQLFVGSESVTPKVHLPNVLHLNSTRAFDGIFFQFTAHEGGINILKVNLPVFRQSDHKLLENNTQITKYDVATLGIKLQDDANRINFGVMISSVIIGIGTVTALVFNVIFSSKAVKTGALFKVFDLLSSPEVRNARTVIHEEYCRQKKLGLTEVKFENTNEIPDLKKQIDLVLSSFDKASVIVWNKLLDDDSFFDAYGEMIVRDWKTLQSEIEKRCQRNPRTLKHFTLLKEKFEKRSDLGDTEPYCEKSPVRGTLPRGF